MAFDETRKHMVESWVSKVNDLVGSLDCRDFKQYQILT